MLDGAALTVEDDRQVYRENRFIAMGLLDERMVILVGMRRNDRLRIISIGKANEREQAHCGPRLGP